MADTVQLAVAPHHRDEVGAKLGMWLFLFTELLLFGGMFLAYSVYRAKFPEPFHNAALELDRLVGTLNTLILLTSSLTVALSIAALQGGKRRLSLFFLAATIALGLLFLVNKYFEWGEKISHGIYPDSPTLAAFDKGEILYFGLYFTMTGLHALHVLVGLAVLGVMFYFIARRPRKTIRLEPDHLDALRGTAVAAVTEKGEVRFRGEDLGKDVEELVITVKYDPAAHGPDPGNVIKLENAGLYWHLVDIIWIFLFPLFYLIT